MRILITGSQTKLGAALIRTLSVGNEVRTLGADDGSGPRPTYTGDLRDRDFAAQVASGCDIVIHQVPLVDRGTPDLEIVDTATRGTYNLITTATDASRFILISSLGIFERYPMEWTVNEWWAPKPTSETADLVPYLAEVIVREVARVRPLKAIALRVGEIVDDESIRGRDPDPRWLHLGDAVQAVERAVAFSTESRDAWNSSWRAFHIVGAGKRTRFPLGLAGLPPFGYRPRYDLTAGVRLPLPPAPSRDLPRMTGKSGGKAHRVVIFGTNGAFGAITTEMLARDHVMRLASRRPVQEVIALNRPQAPGAPMPAVYGPPHEHLTIDVGDEEQVLRAVRGTEGIVNCTVERYDFVEAWRANCLGAYNLVRAAVACGIRRIVQTGPQYVRTAFPSGYEADFGIPSDLPPRPSDALYTLSKFAGQEILRIFAEDYDLEVPVLLWNGIVSPDAVAPSPLGFGPFMVSWEDTALAICRALHAPSFPHPCEVMNIVCDAPMGKISNERAKRLLGWEPRDLFEQHWRRDLD